MKYFSTFIAGLSPVIQKWLIENVEAINILKLLDGLVIYETTIDLKEVSLFPIFNNTFIFLQEFKYNNYSFVDISFEKDWLNGLKTFRIRITEENQLIGLDKTLLGKLEDQIVAKSGMKIDRTNPDTEIWIYKRREGLGLIGLRITKKGNLEKTLNKGELRPELAYLLNYISNPQPDDYFIDLYAGHGAIPKVRVKYFPAKEVIASDIDKNLLAELRKIKTVRVENWDGTNLIDIENNSIDKIVTDPPWGIFIKAENIEGFYSKLLKEFERILKIGGIAVILTAQKELLDKLLSNSESFRQEEKINILVSGKKSAIYKLTKIAID